MLNPTECYITEKFQYLLIHKNGCSMTVDTIKKNFPNTQTIPYINPNIISFAIVRDPWERTISGLCYDLKRTYGKIDEEVLNRTDFCRMFFQPINERVRETGFMSHIISQTTYLFDVKPTFYVMLNDLTSFIEINFDIFDLDKKNKSDVEYKKTLIDILEKRKDIKETIEKYLSIDYYLMDRIKNTEILWDFSMGKMW